MKILVSQDGLQVFTIGTNNLANISLVDIEEPIKMTLHSIGIEGVSFGLFKLREDAVEVFKEFQEFLCSERNCYKVPGDKCV